jgi:hypothetical protein
MQQTIDNEHYKFIPNRVVSFNEIIKKNKTMENDIYEKYEATTLVDGELIICKDHTKMKQRVKKIIREEYNDYLSTLEKRDPKKDQWIYNIIDGVSEQEFICHRDDKCIIIPTYTWDGNDPFKLHFLCIPLDKSLRTIRSLNQTTLDLLLHMKTTTLNLIKDKYGFEKEFIKMFFHYEPSTYHLHIHFAHIGNVDAHSSVEYSHDLDTVIFNIEMCSDYYQLTLLNIRV